ncbi:MAG: flavodoxin family protein, partial [Sphaerochaetaceae bacterium]
MDKKILYMTKTGHSRKIAQAIAEALELEALDAKSNPDLHNTDLLIVVGGIYAGRSNPDLVEY